MKVIVSHIIVNIVFSGGKLGRFETQQWEEHPWLPSLSSAVRRYFCSLLLITYPKVEYNVNLIHNFLNFTIIGKVSSTKQPFIFKIDF